MRSCKPGDEVTVTIEPVIKQGPLHWCKIPAEFFAVFCLQVRQPQIAFARASHPAVCLQQSS
jgi:hypothetical protein